MRPVANQKFNCWILSFFLFPMVNQVHFAMWMRTALGSGYSLHSDSRPIYHLCEDLLPSWRGFEILDLSVKHRRWELWLSFAAAMFPE